MKRLFTFGCSFTYGHWPTWADILGLEYDHYENWGQCGMGNNFIMHSIIECIKRNNINENDDVFIMWSNASRKDIYNKHWQASTTQDVESSTEGSNYITISTISTIQYILDQIGCNYRFFNMSLQNILPNPEVSKIFRDTITKLEPGMFEVVFKSNWKSRPALIPSYYDLRLVQLEYEYNHCKQNHWPDFKFVVDNYKSCSNEIKRKFVLDLPQKDKASIRRINFHPTPLENLMYLLDRKFNLTPRQIKQTKIWEDELISNNLNINYLLDRNAVNRFAT